MQHPKPFYTPTGSQEGSGPWGLDGTEGSGSQPAAACVESLPTVGTSSSDSYHPPNLEKEVFLGPPAGLGGVPHTTASQGAPSWPAGFQMAPCGCFFDPRMYQIECAGTDFGQLPLYTLAAVGGSGPAGGPALPGTHPVEPQHHLKVLRPPPLYPHYQPATGGPQDLMPHFPPKGPRPEAMGFVRGGGPPAFVELPPPLLTESLGPPPPKKNRVPQLVITISNEAVPSPGIYNHLKGHLSQLLGPTKPPAVPVKEPQASCSIPGLLYPPGPGESKVATGEAWTPEAAKAVPEKVPLEDAMKLFDCLLGGATPEGSPSTAPGPALPDSGGSGDDAPSDIRSLHLPDELLSSDYSMPEILDTMSSMGYFFNLMVLDEEPLPHPGLPALSTAVTALRPELPSKRKAGPSAMKGWPRGKGKQAAGPRQDRAAAPY
ncbi:hypothetical protein MC885_000701 [Smutsia gigantea]|nr:hypothetical protein MC885_000701 [Smutsia gigantea]